LTTRRSRGHLALGRDKHVALESLKVLVTALLSSDRLGLSQPNTVTGRLRTNNALKTTSVDLSFKAKSNAVRPS
jgi:hypothetical protein